VNIPGVDPTPNVTGAFDPAAVVTTICALTIENHSVFATAAGIWKLICPGDTNTSGAATPLIVTAVPPRLTGYGAPADALPDARFFPNTAASAPGLTGVDHDAAFTTASTCGTCATAGAMARTNRNEIFTSPSYRPLLFRERLLFGVPSAFVRS
jgi:hypothetical protein